MVIRPFGFLDFCLFDLLDIWSFGLLKARPFGFSPVFVHSAFLCTPNNLIKWSKTLDFKNSLYELKQQNFQSGQKHLLKTLNLPILIPIFIPFRCSSCKSSTHSKAARSVTQYCNCLTAFETTCKWKYVKIRQI